jgi:hypothetical protein
VGGAFGVVLFDFQHCFQQISWSDLRDWPRSNSRKDIILESGIDPLPMAFGHRMNEFVEPFSIDYFETVGCAVCARRLLGSAVFFRITALLQ